MDASSTTVLQGLSFLDGAILVLYLAGLAAVALYHSRKMHSQEDYFLAGRSMSQWPIAFSMFVALFSTNSFLGVTGWVNREDGTIWIGLQNLGILLVVPAVIALYPKIFFRLRLTTAYEYLEKRFDYRVRAFAALFFMAARVMWMSSMIYAASLVIAAMLGWSSQDGGTLGAILLVGIAGMLFAMAGGMYSVIWTDVVQFFVIFGGVAVMVVTAIAKVGGVGRAVEIAAAAGKWTPPPLFDPTQELTVVSGICLGVVGYLSSAGSDQVVLQTYLTAKSVEEARRSLWRNGLFLKPLGLLFPLLGLCLYTYYAVHPQHAALMSIPDDALPIFVTQVMPAGMRGLLVAAIMSAVLTSLGSGLAALSACVQVDFVRRWGLGGISGRSSVLLARGLTLVWGLAVIAGGLLVSNLGKDNNIIQILNMVMYPFAGVLLGIFLLGLLTRRANGLGVLLGAVVGFFVTVTAPLSRRLSLSLEAGEIYLPPQLADLVGSLSQVSTFYYGMLGAVATVAAGSVAQLDLRAAAAAQSGGPLPCGAGRRAGFPGAGPHCPRCLNPSLRLPDRPDLEPGTGPFHLETNPFPWIAKRHGLDSQGSGVWPRPMRGVATTEDPGTTAPGARVSGESGRQQSSPFSSRAIPRAWVSLAGPLASWDRGLPPRRSCMHEIPSRGWMARMSTAAGNPSASVTRFSIQCMP